jgi:hypothetical protein
MAGAGHYRSMDGEPTLKQQLPYPYNQDLSQVLSHLNRRTVLGRQGLANDPVTAAHLAAAMRLVEQHLGPASEPTTEEPHRDGVDLSVLSFLSQRTVAKEMPSNPDPFPRCGTPGMVRATWKSQSDFMADLLSFAFWPAYYPESYQQTRASGAEELVTGDDPAQAIEGLAYRVTEELAEMLSFRLQLIALAIAERNEVVREALAGKYRRAHALWKQVYSEFLEAHKLKLRPGITLDQLTTILTSIDEGAALRYIADPSAEVLNRIERRSLLGTAALAILNGCLQPIEDSDGRSIGEVLNAIFEQNPASRP